MRALMECNTVISCSGEKVTLKTKLTVDVLCVTQLCVKGVRNAKRFPEFLCGQLHGGLHHLIRRQLSLNYMLPYKNLYFEQYNVKLPFFYCVHRFISESNLTLLKRLLRHSFPVFYCMVEPTLQDFLSCNIYSILIKIKLPTSSVYNVCIIHCDSYILYNFYYHRFIKITLCKSLLVREYGRLPT